MRAPTTQVQGIIDLIPGFKGWCDPYSTFEEAWKVCTRGDWMVEFIYRLEPTSMSLHHIGLRAAIRASTIVEKPDMRSMKALHVKDLWLKGHVANNVAEIASNEASQVSYPVGTVHQLVATCIAAATGISSPYNIGVSTSRMAADATVASILRNDRYNPAFEEKAGRVLTELSVQAEFIRHSFKLPILIQDEYRKTRFEREWVI